MARICNTRLRIRIRHSMPTQNHKNDALVDRFGHVATIVSTTSAKPLPEGYASTITSAGGVKLAALWPASATPDSEFASDTVCRHRITKMMPWLIALDTSPPLCPRHQQSLSLRDMLLLTHPLEESSWPLYGPHLQHQTPNSHQTQYADTESQK